MRITRNYRNGLMSARMASENTSLFQKALSRNSSSRSTSRAALILNSMGKTNSLSNINFAAAAKTDKFYYDMEYHARQTQEYADALSSSEKDSIYDKARESGSTEEIQSKIRGFVSQYNNMINDLEESGSRTDKNLLTQLNSMAQSSNTQLATTGVSRRSDGTLVIDEKKLAAADVDTLEKVWGSKNSFAERTSARAVSVQAVAKQNMKAQKSSTYTNPFDISNLYANYGSKGNYFNFFR